MKMFKNRFYLSEYMENNIGEVPLIHKNKFYLDDELRRQRRELEEIEEIKNNDDDNVDRWIKG